MTAQLVSPEEGPANPLSTSPLPVHLLLRKDVLILLAIFVALYWMKLSGLNLSIDDEYAALRTSPNVWVLDGRWCQYLFERFFVSQSIVPFFPIFLFGLCMSISYAILLTTFGVRNMSGVHYLAFPFYVAFPTWTFLAAFASNIGSAGVAQLGVVCALYCYRGICAAPATIAHKNHLSTAKRCALAIGLLGCAIGLYQSFLFTFAVLGLGMLMSQPHWQASLGKILRHLVALAAIALGGLILYAVMDVAFRHALHLPNTGYLGGFVDLPSLMRSPLLVLWRTCESMYDIYAGVPSIFGIAAFAFPALLVIGGTAIVFSGAASPRRRLALLLGALVLLGIPFAQNPLNGGRMPIRALVAVPCVFWLFALRGLTARSRTTATISLAAVLLGLLQIIYSSSLLNAAQPLARIHDAQLAGALYLGISAANGNFDSSKNYAVDFYGARSFQTNYPRPPSSTAGYSFFEWDGGNEERILDYMRLIGYTNLRAPSPEQRKQDLAIFQQMPVWPARDSVRVAGDVTLIKLGPTPGYPFNTK